jgi:hypothetical protein
MILLKKFISALILLSLFSIQGCYSFYSTDINELRDITEKEDVEINFEDGKKLILYDIQKIELKDDKDIEFVKNDSVRSVFPFNEIKGLAVERFDYTKTILGLLFVIIAVILINGGIPLG